LLGFRVLDCANYSAHPSGVESPKSQPPNGDAAHTNRAIIRLYCMKTVSLLLTRTITNFHGALAWFDAWPSARKRYRSPSPSCEEALRDVHLEKVENRSSFGSTLSQFGDGTPSRRTYFGIGSPDCTYELGGVDALRLRPLC
jgi:hypothetical protein